MRIHHPGDIKAIGVMTGIEDPHQPVYWLSDQEEIGEIFRALMDKNTVITGGTRHFQMAVVGKEGQLILFNEHSQSQMGPGERLDNYKEYTPNLKPFYLPKLLDCEPSHARMPISRPVSIENSSGGNKTWTTPLVTRVSTDSRLWPLVYRLVWQFNPDTINPIVNLGVTTMDYWTAKVNHLKIALSAPVSFRILVYPRDMQGLSDLPCTDAAFQTVAVDTIIVLPGNGEDYDRPLMSLAFGSRGKNWYRTGLLPRREVKGYDKDGNPILGKDLFDELVKELQKIAK
jgi:hypothetical protein